MRITIAILTVMLTCSTAFSQFKIGPNIGIPLFDASDYYSLEAGIDLLYLFGDNPDALLKFGVASGFYNYFGDEIDGFDIDDSQFIPIAGAARIIVLKTLVVGPDIGYAVGISDDSEGAFYWKLVAGIDLGNVIELTAFVHGIPESGFTYGAAGLGLLFEF